MQEEIGRLKQELEKARAQLYIFYEVTKAMRTTLRLDEIAYVILTGLTAHQGLSFNRAMLFLTDDTDKKINGFMGVGPIDGQEANIVWQHIESAQKDLYDLINDYNQIKKSEKKPRFMKLIQTLSFALDHQSGILYHILFEKNSVHFTQEETADLKNDPLINKLQLKEFLAASLWIQNRPAGIILVDNYITHKPIDKEDVKIFDMFLDQAAGAIENSKTYENSLTRAHTDPLTLLWNHGYFQYKLDEELERIQGRGRNLSVTMIDIDDFKKFNDSRGHIEGDKALKKISEIIKDNCRKVDIVCRYGGEEFALISPDADKEGALFLAERIRKAIQDEVILENNFTISLGIAAYPQDSNEKESLIRKADAALYAAKTQGKNKTVLA